MTLIEELIYKAQNDEMIDSNYTESGKLMIEAANLLRTLYSEIYFIKNDYIELSHHKIQLQRDDYIKRCQKMIKLFHEYDESYAEDNK